MQPVKLLQSINLLAYQTWDALPLLYCLFNLNATSSRRAHPLNFTKYSVPLECTYILMYWRSFVFYSPTRFWAGLWEQGLYIFSKLSKSNTFLYTWTPTFIQTICLLCKFLTEMMLFTPLQTHLPSPQFLCSVSGPRAGRTQGSIALWQIKGTGQWSGEKRTDT